MAKTKISAEKMVLIALALLGAFWIIESLKLDLWVRRGPGGGFLPLLAGILCMVFSLQVLFQSFKSEKDTSHFDKAALYPIGALLLTLLATYLIGMFFSMIVFVFLWLFFFEKTPFKNSLAVAVIWPSVLYAVFVLWLQCPLPKGLLGLL